MNQPQRYAYLAAVNPAVEIGLSFTYSGYTAFNAVFLCPKKHGKPMGGLCEHSKEWPNSIGIGRPTRTVPPTLIGLSGAVFQIPIGLNAMTNLAIATPSVSIVNNHAVTTSKAIAEFFHKRHDHVLRDIKNLLTECGDWGVPNFEETPYIDPQNGQTYPAYEITKDGFALLAMGFTGKKALAFKIAYIQQFNATEAELLKKEAPNLRTKKALPNGLTLEQCDSVKALVKARVEACPKDKQAKAAITCWSALKSKFGCTYNAIEPEHFPEALSLVARLPLEGEYLAHGEQQVAVAELPEIDVREHMVGWIKSNIQLEGDLAALADEKAVSLALEFHNLAREHIARKVAYTCVTNKNGLDKAKAKTAIKEVTLNKALTLKFHGAVQHILHMSQAALELNKQYMSEMEAAISLH